MVGSVDHSRAQAIEQGIPEDLWEQRVEPGIHCFESAARAIAGCCGNHIPNTTIGWRPGYTPPVEKMQVFYQRIKEQGEVTNYSLAGKKNGRLAQLLFAAAVGAASYINVKRGADQRSLLSALSTFTVAFSGSLHDLAPADVKYQQMVDQLEGAIKRNRGPRGTDEAIHDWALNKSWHVIRPVLLSRRYAIASTILVGMAYLGIAAVAIPKGGLSEKNTWIMNAAAILTQAFVSCVSGGMVYNWAHMKSLQFGAYFGKQADGEDLLDANGEPTDAMAIEVDDNGEPVINESEPGKAFTLSKSCKLNLARDVQESTRELRRQLIMQPR